jgi:hypothetical protein
VTVPAVLAPLFAQVALTFALLIWTGRARFAAARAGEVKIQDIALGQSAWPARVQQASNTFQNQFELPVLFYVLTALVLFTRKADLLFVVMAWVFVMSRFGHAYVYVTSNHVLTRFRVFLVGAIILMAMWLIFAVRILLGG